MTATHLGLNVDMLLLGEAGGQQDLEKLRGK